LLPDGSVLRRQLAEHNAGKWQRRFAEDGIESLADEYRIGQARTVSAARVIERTLNTTPKDATHWSIPSMAAGSAFWLTGGKTTIRCAHSPNWMAGHRIRSPDKRLGGMSPRRLSSHQPQTIKTGNSFF